MTTPLVDNVVLFTRALGRAGLDVAATASLDALCALEIIGVTRRDDVQAALASVLVRRHDDLPTFNRLFAQFWRVWPERTGADRPRPMSVPRRAVTRVQWNAGPGVPAEREPPAPLPDATVPVQTYSRDELWRRKDFALYDADDIARAQAVLARLRWSPGLRLTRRWNAAARGAVDARRLLRVNLRTAGEPLVIPRRTRRRQPRPLVVLCDVSGSMEPYARILLLFLHALAQRQHRVELFLFATRLTRITRPFVRQPVNQALLHVRDTARDFAGGTRIGDAIKTFNVQWARRSLRAGAVVLLISDGWDLGSPDVLRAEIARLQRRCHRLVWLNPLIGSPGYAPLTRGLQAALPLVDDFLSVRNMDSLDALAAHLEHLDGSTR